MDVIATSARDPLVGPLTYSLKRASKNPVVANEEPVTRDWHVVVRAMRRSGVGAGLTFGWGESALLLN